MSKTDLSELKELLSSTQKIVIIGHKNPDGDAIGSSLGLYHYLTSKGHKVKVVMPNDYPVFLKWMPGTEQVMLHDENRESAEAIVNDTDVLFVMEFSKAVFQSSK